MKEVFDGIYDEWFAHGALRGVLPRFYFTEAPPKSTLPYGVYWQVTQIRTDTFNTNSEEYSIQIDSYDNHWDATDILAIQAQVHACFDWCVLVVAGWNPIYMMRELTDLVREEDCWHGIDQYRIEVQS